MFACSHFGIKAESSPGNHQQLVTIATMDPMQATQACAKLRKAQARRRKAEELVKKAEDLLKKEELSHTELVKHAKTKVKMAKKMLKLVKKAEDLLKKEELLHKELVKKAKTKVKMAKKMLKQALKAELNHRPLDYSPDYSLFADDDTDDC